MHLLPFFLQGMLLGLSAGASPGPIVTLAVSETLRFGKKGGVLIALAPLFEIPLFFVLFLGVSTLSQIDYMVGAISLAGALFLGYLAWNNFHIVATNEVASLNSNQKQIHMALWKGILTNFLSPFPYIIFLTVGIPLISSALQNSWGTLVSLGVGFYGSLVGAQIVLVLIAAKSKNLLGQRGYQIFLRTLAILLALFALKFLWEGLKMLGIFS